MTLTLNQIRKYFAQKNVRPKWRSMERADGWWEFILHTEDFSKDCRIAVHQHGRKTAVYMTQWDEEDGYELRTSLETLNGLREWVKESEVLAWSSEMEEN